MGDPGAGRPHPSTMAPQGRCGYAHVVSSAAVFAPSILLTVTVERRSDVDELHLHPGGQGVWSARMLSTLEVDAVLCGCVGGESGSVVRHLLDREGIEHRLVDTEGASGSYVHDRRDGERRELVDLPPAALSRHELDDLYGLTLSAGMESGVVVLTGTQGSGNIPTDVYRRLAADLAATGVPVVSDLSGEEAAAALDGGVDVFKCSHSEAIEDGWARGSTTEELIGAARRMRSAGAAAVVISRAEGPTVALLEDRAVLVEPPQLQVVDHRGAGDSMTAALAAAVAEKGGLDDEGLRTAAASGSLNVTRHGLGRGHSEAIAQLAERVSVRELSP